MTLAVLISSTPRVWRAFKTHHQVSYSQVTLRLLHLGLINTNGRSNYGVFTPCFNTSQHLHK